MNNLNIIAVILGIFLLEEGIIYAYQIKFTPISPGYTFLSVATGFNMIFNGLVSFLLLYSAGGVISLDIVLMIIVICGVVIAALGGPMFVTQWRKKVEVDQQIGKMDGDNFHNL